MSIIKQDYGELSGGGDISRFEVRNYNDGMDVSSDATFILSSRSGYIITLLKDCMVCYRKNLQSQEIYQGHAGDTIQLNQGNIQHVCVLYE